MRHRALILMTALALLAASPATSTAQEADPTKAAQEQFLKGRDAYKRGDYTTALGHFQKSQETLPTPGTLLNLALCEEQLGMIASAWLHFQELSTLVTKTDERYAVAKQHASALEPRVPKLTIELAPGVPTGTSVTRGSIAVAGTNLGAELPVDPGKHVITVSAPGREAKAYEITLEEGKKERLKVEPGPPLAPTADPAGPIATPGPALTASSSGQPPPPPPPRSGGPRTAGFVIGGVGALGLVLGGVTGALTIAKTSDVEAMCPMPDRCTTEGVAIADSARTFGLVSTIAFAAGAAGVGIGAVLVLTSKPGGPEPATALAPLVLPGGAGLSARHSF
jgi:hypothetical protein